MKLNWSGGGRQDGIFLKVCKEVFKNIRRGKCVMKYDTICFLCFPEGFGSKWPIISFELFI